MSIDIVKRFEEMLPIFIDEQGFAIGCLLALHHDDTVSVARLATQQEEIFDIANANFIADLTVKEVIFGIDCYTNPGQGTRYNDVLTVFWWSGEHLENDGFRFGVINYKPAPNPVIDPIDWNNTFWNGKMAGIVEGQSSRMRAKVEAAKKKFGAVVIDQMFENIHKAKNDIIDKA